MGILLSETVTIQDPEIPWEAISEGSLTPAEWARQRRAWAWRVREERRAMLAAAERLQDMTELGRPIEEVAWASRIVRDEARHLAIVSRLASALGTPMPPEPDATWVRGDRSRPLADRVALSIVSTLCIGEALTVAHLVAARDETANRLLRTITSLLVSDGAQHNRRAYAWLRHNWLALPVTSRLYVELRLPDVFTRLEHGPVGQRVDLFYVTIFEQIIPQLERVGVSAERAWEQRTR